MNLVGTCAGCHEQHGLSSTGHVRWHLKPQSAGVVRERCGGTGLKPCNVVPGTASALVFCRPDDRGR